MVRALIRIASWIVPAPLRPAWHARWAACVRDWRLLADRGEPVGGPAPLVRRALREAVGERWGPIHVRPLLRSPMFVPIAIAAVSLLIAAASRGFAVTRSVFAIAHDIRAHPAFCGPYDARGDHVFIFLAPTVLALAVGIGLIGMGCRSLHGRGWRYWSFFAFKCVSLLILITLIWADIGTLLRSPIRHQGWRLLTAIPMTFAYIVAMGRAMLWAVADQRRRCPMCLRRLVAPIPVGSWASLFEPAATELLCENGHGALAIADAETNAQDRWTRLDESWRALFG